ncbi:hypothetical protein [Flavobacterium chilense]|uniref:Uncharacterized protein n=1 Tax=Flavobacterium chilense TaxID=946677 RepID=A0A1M6Y6J0_9FLAO|nr:hypothetical protein [Flavobacterium chilense]SHL13619.1 hypothetical protein SAMN05444484_101430 [Flavobacterium chilense]
METNETKKLNYLKELASRYCNTLTTSKDKTETYTAQIKVANYFELGCMITETLKLCIAALEQDAHQVSSTIKYSPINVALILEMVLAMFPLDEFELITEINEALVGE